MDPLDEVVMANAGERAIVDEYPPSIVGGGNYSENENNVMEDDYYNDFAFFSRAQYVTLFVVGLFSCILSIGGSVLILYLVLHGKRYKDGGLYHRLLLGLSVSDLIVTFSLLLQPFLTPELTGYPFARGNATTCAVIGFGYLYFVASYTYNCLLGMYFLLTVRYQMTQRRIAAYIEPWGHVIAFCFPTAIGILAVVFELLNPNPFLGICNVFPTTHECEWHENSPDIECVNQTQYMVVNSMLDYYALIMAACGLICTSIVYATVQTRYKKSVRSSFSKNITSPLSVTSNRDKCMASSSDNNSIEGLDGDVQHDCNDCARSVELSDAVSNHDGKNDPDDREDDDSRHSREEMCLSKADLKDHETDQVEAASMDEGQRKRLQQIGMQAVWYAAAYMVGLLVVLAANIIDTVYLDTQSTSSDLTKLGEEPAYFAITLLIWLLFPLQGFFNGMIYIRPRLVRWKHHFEGCSWWFAFLMVLTNEAPPRWGEKTVTVIDKPSRLTDNTARKVCPNEDSPKENVDAKCKSSSTNGSKSPGGSPLIRDQVVKRDIQLVMPQFSDTAGDSDNQDSSLQNPVAQNPESYWNPVSETSSKKAPMQRPRRVTFSSITFADDTVAEFIDSETDDDNSTNTKWQAEHRQSECSKSATTPKRDRRIGGKLFSRWQSQPGSSASNASSSKKGLRPPQRYRSSDVSSRDTESSLEAVNGTRSVTADGDRNNAPPRLPVRLRSLHPADNDSSSSMNSPPKMPVRIPSHVEDKHESSVMSASNKSVIEMWTQISGREESTEWGTLSLGIDDDCDKCLASTTNSIIDPDNDHNNDSPIAMRRPLEGGGGT